MARIIGHININGLKPKKHELTQFLHDNNIDILSLNETFLHNDDPPNIPHYTLITQNRPDARGGGGVAFLIKNSIQFNLIQKGLAPNEHITIQVTTTNNVPLLITTVYCPDRHTRPDGNLFDRICNQAPNNLFLGDFNAKHPRFGNTSTNTNGRALSDIVNTHDLILLNDDSPTHIAPTGTSDILDLALCSPPLANSFRNFKVVYELSSDHYPFLLTTTTDLLTNRPGPFRPRISKNYNKTNWELYAEHLLLNPPPDLPLTTPADIDAQVQLTTTAIKTSLDISSPDRRNHTKAKDFLLPAPILHLIRLKNRLRKNYQQTRNPQTKTQITRLTNLTRRLTTNFHKERWKEACSELNSNTPPSTRWKIFRRLSGNAKRPPYPTLVTPDTTAKTDQEKANLFNGTMNSIQNDLNDPNFNDPHKHQIDSLVQNYPQLFNPLPTTEPDPPLDPLTLPFTAEEILTALKKTKNTSPGTDSIPFRALKLGPPTLLTHLARLYNACLALGYFPKAWKIAKLTMIPKPNKNHADPKNYRPISLLSTLGKTLERLVKNRIYPHLEANHFFNNFQAGFRTQRSTTDQLTYYTQTVYEAFNKRKLTTAAFLDVEKAFDAVWHNGLRHKLARLNLPAPLTRLLSDFLRDRTTFTEVNGYRSPSYSPRAGVPQGSVLSPLLFIVYINDIPPPTKHIKISQFADDIAVWTASNHYHLALYRLQNYLDRLQTFCNHWRIKLNPLKTAYLIHHRHPPRNPPNDPIYIQNHPVAPSPTAKFLGLTLNSSLNWSQHFTDISNRASYRISLLRRVAARGRGSSPDVTINIYKQFIRPLFDYGCPATLTLSKTALRKIQKLQNRALTIALNLPRTTAIQYTHAFSNTPTIADRLGTLAEKYFSHKRIKNKSKLYKRLRHIKRLPQPQPRPPRPSPVFLALYPNAFA